MTELKITQTTPKELVDLIATELSKEFHRIIQEDTQQKNQKPHFTRKETADFFNVSPNCINDWRNKGILKAYKVGQRTYFKKSECLNILFKQDNNGMK